MATAQKIEYWLELYNAAYRRCNEAEALGNTTMLHDCEKLGDKAIESLEALGVAISTLVRDEQSLTWMLPTDTVASAASQ